MTKYAIKHIPAKDVTVYLPSKHIHHMPESWLVIDAEDEEKHYGSFESKELAIRHANVMARGDEPEADYSA